ncbi:alpha/beta fold hydrolase [Mycobacterium sp. CBMA293]|uniref:alpha/beta fold hydrolase n=1 Tax=unclassified Mycolicibacterium TaxID=2636767 RepID=UPI0012DF0D95|nr:MULTISPECIES: alpha/beta fold hydrolase [unclassified Mycolicibacterium]MUL45870.1 alpha/beta fold hydrolase [Mycolicibacterium sp. CBMA 360]MUL60542.1 alpha/beta fold hydrolase [Mycolicibacterium sp. CBMA 335]MUL72357.1 alpha/beta fold hydrolase [Mycolicibacterium sp. CBMA 311]MUL95242.1 alpha/beta fold hydrolase [Mycolicibacterium sp. CBMA 230]MUM06939.1 alpha/beta hydrolase [Mycolicibacterium sp. CBMA 213]
MAETTNSVRPAWVDDDLFPFESHFVEIDGHTVHYIDEGSGPTLLFLHGNPTWSFLFRDVIRALRDDFRCVALDYPGFGLSTPRPGYRFLPEEHADVVTSFVDALSLKEVTLVGQDWGGMIGLAVAQRRPGVFGRFVLVNTWAWPVNGDLHFEAFGRIMGGLPTRFLVRQFNLLVNAFIPTGHRRRKPTAAEMMHYRMALNTPQRRQASAVLPGQVLASRDFFAEVEAGLADVAQLPTLIVWGDADIAFRPQERERLEATFPNHHTVIVNGAGTYVESDAPDEFVAAIRDWTAS